MDVKGVREALFELTSSYFKGATVMFGRQSRVAKQKRDKPLVILATGPVTRPLFPPTKIIDGRPVSFYPSSVTVQIDLFTFGEKRELAYGYTAVMENTATDDMMTFVNFLNSEMAVQYCRRKDISIIVPNTVQDLSDLISDTSYEYRAMIEVTVHFTSAAIGYSGTLSPDSVHHEELDEEGNPITGGDIQADDVTELVPVVDETPSGGGNPEVVENEGGYFENVEINDKLVKEEKNQ